jgi:H+/Cl- antiporter ClcA
MSCYDTFVDPGHGSTNEPNKSGRRGRFFVQMQVRLAIPVLLVGLGGGVTGAAYIGALDVLTRTLGPGSHTVLVQAAIFVAVGVAITVISRLLGDTGNVELLVDNIHVLGGAEDVRRLRSLIPTSLLCISAGGAMGPEAPLVQASGTLGTWLAGRFDLDAEDMRVLTITGMAAGFAVLFGAPLGAALFALEILHRRGLQYYEALLPALIGALIGFAANVALTGAGLEPLWQFPAVGSLKSTDLLWAVAIGVLGAAGAVMFTLASAAARHVLARVPAYVIPAFGGLVLAGLFWWSPFALTNGEGQVQTVVAGSLTASALVVAIAAKFAGVITTIAGRWKGGFIIPLFFMGFAGGQLVHLAFPSSNATVLMAGLAVALCVGVTKTPLGSTLAVTQMAGLTLLPMTLIAAVLALVLTSSTVMIETQRERTPTRVDR